MEITKWFVEKMLEKFSGSGVIISPIYNLKEIDVKRGDFVLVYTEMRDMNPASIGGRLYFEDVIIYIDFRTSKFDKYWEWKNKIKGWLHDNIRAWDEIGDYNLLIDEEMEKSDKTRGLYWFIIRCILKRVVDFRNTIIMWENFNLFGVHGWNKMFGEDVGVSGDVEWVVLFEEVF